MEKQQRKKALGRDVISFLIRHDRGLGVQQSHQDQLKFSGKYLDLYVFLDFDVNVINKTYWFLNGCFSFFYPATLTIQVWACLGLSWEIEKYC